MLLKKIFGRSIYKRVISSLWFILIGVLGLQGSDFITRWDLSKTGSSGNNSISFFTTNASGSIGYTWQEVSPGSASGSGSFAAGTAQNRSITGLPANAIIELSIAPANLERFYISGGTNRSRLVDVIQWGSVSWTSMMSMFTGCNNLNITSTGIPDLSSVTSMREMFSFCGGLSSIANMGAWNTSTITNMQEMFAYAGVFNQNIASWNVSNVTNMAGMFLAAAQFNQNIGSWNTGSVMNMAGMFNSATAFNQYIGSWNTGNVTDMSGMFESAVSFNQNIGGWNTGNVTTMKQMFMLNSQFNQNIGSWNTAKVTDMSYMFAYAVAFNQNIGSWNTGKVADMNSMFNGASAFNQDIGGWNTENVTDMSYMFYGHTTSVFNQNIGSWNTGKVTNMLSMFQNATAFNQNIGNWNVGSVTNMSAMFYSATSFNQDLKNWNVNNVSNMSYMFTNATAFNQNVGYWSLNNNVNLTGMLNRSGLTCDNYSRTLALWGSTTSATNRQLGALGRVYGINVLLLRNELVGTKAWSVLDSGSSGSVCGPVIYYSKSTGFLNDVATWGDNADGTGNNPINFTTADQIFIVKNRAAADFNNNWLVSGANSMVVVGDGTNPITVNTGTHLIGGSFRVTNNATLNIESNSTGKSIIGETGSTVNYSGTGSQTIAEGIYYNMGLSNNRGGNTMTLANGNITVRGTMTHTITNAGSWTNTGNTFRYSSTGAQSIAPIQYNNLMVEGVRSGAPSITLGTGTVGVAGDFAVSATGLGSWVTTGNTVDYNGSTGQQLLPLSYNNIRISGNKNTGAVSMPSGTVKVSGSLNVSATNIGSWVTTGNTVEYNGTIPQTVASVIPYQNLVIGGSGNKTLDGITVISGDLTLNNKITLSAYNLSLSGAVIGSGSSNYVQTNGSGVMKKTIANGSTFTFPVGNGAYNPVSITNNTGSADEFSAGVMDEVYYGGLTGNVASEPRVRRTWKLGKTGPNSGSGINMTFNWNADEESGGINSERLYLNSGSGWQMQTGSTSVTGTALTYTGFTGGLSSFAIGDDIVILPVAWLYMHCRRLDENTAELKWATASENSTQSFQILRSNSNGVFEVVGEITSSGTSHVTKQFVYKDSTGSKDLTSYQIRMLSEVGGIAYSEICSIQAFDDKSETPIRVFPNPAESIIYLDIEQTDGPIAYTLFNCAGQVVMRGDILRKQAVISLSSIAPGLYFLQVRNGERLHREQIWVK
jgi:surface protein